MSKSEAEVLCQERAQNGDNQAELKKDLVPDRECKISCQNPTKTSQNFSLQPRQIEIAKSNSISITTLYENRHSTILLPKDDSSNHVSDSIKEVTCEENSESEDSQPKQRDAGLLEADSRQVSNIHRITDVSG